MTDDSKVIAFRLPCNHGQHKARDPNMATVTVRNLPAEVHRALRVRAATRGRNTEAKIRDILESTVRPPKRLRLSSVISVCVA